MASAARSARQDGDAKPRKKKIKTTKVVNGIEQEVEIEVDDVPGAGWRSRSELTVLNHDLPRVDGPLKVSGRARFTHDVRLPGMLWARVLTCPLPSAEVALDLAPARKIAGVEAAIALVEGATRHLGQPVAAVAARTPELAEDGLRHDAGARARPAAPRIGCPRSSRRPRDRARRGLRRSRRDP
jgi:xanthine dehydrogenase YagR molybdenum-binding subunit